MSCLASYTHALGKKQVDAWYLYIRLVFFAREAKHVVFTYVRISEFADQDFYISIPTVALSPLITPHKHNADEARE